MNQYGLIKGVNDLATKFPEIAAQWDYEKNGSLTPSDVMPYSVKKVWWRCVAGHSWPISVYARCRGDRCPYCSNRKVLSGFNDLATKFPEIAAQWDYGRNGNLAPSDVLPGTISKAWWRCHLGHVWPASVKGRVRGSGCPYCSNRKVLSGFNDLATKFPEIAAQWDYEKNGGLTPSDVMPGAATRVWWLCSLRHSWPASVNARTSGCGCPYCSNHKVLSGFNDLATKFPEIAAQWDYQKNGELAPEKIAPHFRQRVWWRCSLGHSWPASVVSRTANGRNCPFCSGNRILKGFNDLATTHPNLIAEWDYEGNGKLTPEQVSLGSGRMIRWKCKLGHAWSATTNSRAGQGSGCPYCSGNKVLPGFNDLKTVNPALAAQWDATRNGRLSPEQVTANSGRKVWWLCSKGHGWPATVAARNDGNGCPYCAGRIPLPGENDFASLFPHLAVEWDAEKNGALTPDALFPHNRRKVWWKCEYGHHWRASPENRQRGSGCPYCFGFTPRRMRLV